MVNLVDIIKAKAELNGWAFILVDNNSYNFEFSNLDLSDGKKVLAMSKSTPSPIFSGGYYTGEFKQSPRLFIGRKFELDTFSTVAETYAQKYDARLKELEQDLYWLLVDLNCTTDLISLVPETFNHVVNFLSTSVDGVDTGVAFTFSGQYER